MSRKITSLVRPETKDSGTFDPIVVNEVNQHPADGTEIPLVVDLDGTLTPTDTLHESIASLIKQSPMSIFFFHYGRFAAKLISRPKWLRKSILTRHSFPTISPCLTGLPRKRAKDADSY